MNIICSYLYVVVYWVPILNFRITGQLINVSPHIGRLKEKPSTLISHVKMAFLIFLLIKYSNIKFDFIYIII